LKTIWVLENIRKHRSFYTKFDLLMMFTSVIQWKKYHPSFTTELHIDKLTYSMFDELGVLSLWDNIEILAENKFIDKNVFWASSKLQVLRNVKEPVVIMDNDFIVYKSFEKFLKEVVVVAHDENGKGYYLSPMDPILKQVRNIISRPKLDAINCSFLYFPDYNFTQSYSSTSLDLMSEFTRLKAPNSKYLIYAEQLLLKHLLDLHEIQYKTLIDTVYICDETKWKGKSDGFIEFKDAYKYYRHYWKEKVDIKDNKNGFSYDDEMRQLDNIVKNRILVKWNELNTLS